MAIYRTNTTELTSIADAIRAMNDSNMPLEYPNGFVNGIKDISRVPISYGGVAEEEWIRPNDWPDLDSLEIGEDEQVVYLTYDLRKTPGYGWVGLFVQLNNNDVVNLARGHISNGEFISDQETSFPTEGWATRIRYPLDSANGDVQLFRVTSPIHIDFIGFIANSTDSSECYYNMLQPCVERKGRLDYASPLTGNLSNSPNETKHGTFWLENDSLIMGSKCKVTSLEYIWYNCYNLRKINFEEWDTSLWDIQRIRYAFNNCFYLQSLDTTTWHTENWHISNQSLTSVFQNCFSLKEIKGIENWDVSNWEINNLENTWAGCYCLESLDLSKWDVSNWRPQYFSGVWNSCMNLKKLDISTWDVSNWPIYTLNSCWTYCSNLTTLDISNWDTSKWNVHSMGSVWSMCYSLRKLDISKWDTSNWEVTSLYQTWAHCHDLRELDLSNWDTSNWKVNDIRGTWTYCYALKKLELNNWDTSGWTPTLMEATWSYCYSLKKLEIEDWNTSNWELTSIYTAWYHCESLQSLNLSKWDVSNWAITSSMGYAWSACYSLQSLDLSNWNTSNWAVVSWSYTWSSCHCLKSLDISHFDMSNWEVGAIGYLFSTCYNLKSLKLPSVIGCTSSVSGANQFSSNYNLTEFTGFPVAINQSYSNSYNLTKESLVSMLNALPTVTSTKTITIGTINIRKLTAEQIAIATNKGWTVA